MDETFRRYYNQELQYLRESGSEFADAFPKIAGRLGIKGIDCADPYVERLLEGFAFLTARVRLKIDAEFPRFTRHLLDVVYPNYIAPMPSMAVVEFNSDPSDGPPADGFEIPRGSSLLSLLGRGEQTRCEYRTGHNLTLWPVRLVSARYYPNAASLSSARVPAAKNARAGIGLKFETTGGQRFNELALSQIPLFLKGSGALPGLIYEQMIGHALGVVARSGDTGTWFERLGPSCLRQLGFGDDESLLPCGDTSFGGYRLLQEYFAFPQRFFFVAIDGLAPAVRRSESSTFEVVILLDQSRGELIDVLSEANFGLHCSPAINLFPRRADRIHLNTRDFEFHVLPDRTRPMDFEVWSVTGVKGFGTGADEERRFKPLYGTSDDATNERQAFYVVNREPRRFSGKQMRNGARTTYMGSECFVSLVDPAEAPYPSGLKQLEVQTLSTNRDLPLQMAIGQGQTDFDLQSGAPVKSVRCVAGPSRPRTALAEGDATWQLINSLSLNYLSLIGTGGGAEAMRTLLKLFCSQGDPSFAQHVEGLVSVRSEPLLARLPSPGPITFGRGLAIHGTFDEAAFEGVGAFLMGAVLERFFARYVSVNSFTQTHINSVQGGGTMRWPVRAGQRRLL